MKIFFTRLSEFYYILHEELVVIWRTAFIFSRDTAVLTFDLQEIRHCAFCAYVEFFKSILNCF